MMKDIICVMGKSCAGKSTRIKHLKEQFDNRFYIVKSFSDRRIRESDPNDVNTHEFVSKDVFEQHKKEGKIMSLYTSPLGYHNWITRDSFSDSRINLLAIDTIAYVDFFDKYKDEYSICGIYHNIPESIRKDRYMKRNGNLDGFEEPHLDVSNIPDLDSYDVVLLYD